MHQGDLTRWMYHGQRPHRLAMALNGLWAKLAAAGLGAGRVVTLEVRGRTTGRPISLPVVPVMVDGQRYLVSMLGDNVSWVLNVRAAGGRAVLRHRDREEGCLKEVAPDLRAPIVKAYLQRAPGARPHIRVDKDAPLSAFESVAAAVPTFRVLGRDPGAKRSR